MVVIAIAAIAVIAVTTMIILFINLCSSLGGQQFRGFKQIHNQYNMTGIA